MLKTLFLLACAAPDEWADFAKLAADKDPDKRVQAIDKVKPHADARMARALLPLLADDHPKVRLRARQALQSVHDPDGLDYLIKTGLRHPHARVRQGVCEALGSICEPATVPALVGRLADPDPNVRGEAARSLGRRGDADIVEDLAGAFRKERDWPLRAYGLESLARLDPATSAELLAMATEERHYQVRMVAAERAEALEKLLADRDWRVRVAAIEACRELRARECVGWLVDRLAQEKGRLRWDALVALQDLTGKDLGLDAKTWRPWWEANKETLEVRPKPGKGGPAPDPGATQASFFKIPVLSKAIVFLLDLSGSMRDPSPGNSGLTKLDAAKKGMIETIRALEPDVRFGIAGLGCDIDGRYALREKKTWRGRLALLPAAPGCKADAERFVRGLEAKGWTNLYDGIEYAFEDPEVDTVYLYSDGGASKGAFVASGEILSQLALMNRFRRIVLHTVEVPGERNPEDNRRLLRDMAEVTQGTSVLEEKKPRK